MTHGSLFSGIGGFDLAAEWMGWENVFHCEINKFCQKILKQYWPNAELYEDITTTDFTGWRRKIDIITGGFPCQPYSTAGKRKGKADERHLWPEMLRAIREIQPRWVVGENVPGLLNWQRGMVLAEIKADLEAAGFEVFPPVILPACGKNAPHRRDRLWIVANSGSFGNARLQCELDEPNDAGGQGRKNDAGGQGRKNNAEGAESNVTDTSIIGQQGQRWAERQGDSKESRNWQKHRAFNDGGWPIESPICRGNDGLSEELDGITFRKWSTESIKGFGNAIVPQIAYEIFKAIESLQKSTQ